MIVRLVLAAAIVSAIFIASPVRHGSEPAALFEQATAGAADVARRSAGPAAAVLVSTASASALHATVNDLASAAWSSDRPAPRATTRAAVDTLQPGDRRPAWRGVVRVNGL